MKKTILTLTFISMFAVAVLADGPSVPPNSNCTKGHINTPILVCEPPPQPRNANGENGNDSVVAVIKDWIIQFNPLEYFLN